MVELERNLLRDLQLINLLFADYACYKKITLKNWPHQRVQNASKSKKTTY